MKEKEQNLLERKLDEQSFETAAKSIEDGKENGNLNNPELVEELVEKYKGKTLSAPIEVIAASAIFLNVRELMGTIEALKHTLHIKMVKELRAKAEKGEATVSDAMAALMLAEVLRKEQSKEN